MKFLRRKNENIEEKVKFTRQICDSVLIQAREDYLRPQKVLLAKFGENAKNLLVVEQHKDNSWKYIFELIFWLNCMDARAHVIVPTNEGEGQ